MYFCCCLCYSQRLIAALEVSVYHEHPTSTKGHRRKNVGTWKRWRIWKKLFTFSAPNNLPRNLFKYSTTASNQPSALGTALKRTLYTFNGLYSYFLFQEYCIVLFKKLLKDPCLDLCFLQQGPGSHVPRNSKAH
jgi:hypothetical protein